MSSLLASSATVPTSAVLMTRPPPHGHPNLAVKQEEKVAFLAGTVAFRCRFRRDQDKNAKQSDGDVYPQTCPQVTVICLLGIH